MSSTIALATSGCCLHASAINSAELVEANASDALLKPSRVLPSVSNALTRALVILPALALFSPIILLTSDSLISARPKTSSNVFDTSKTLVSSLESPFEKLS